MNNYEPTDDFLDPSQLGRLRDALDDDLKHVGNYELLKQVGEGGFGLVFQAKQSEPIQRIVAIKLLKRGMDSEAVLRRFELERQALASMNHPGIAQVFDAGISDSGQHYFVMEFVDSSAITDWADEKQLNTSERLELFSQVCDAVAHAHQKGILHRDIKPSNVLVTEADGRAQVKVIDFGIAKAIGATAFEMSQITQGPMMIGTPEYMSPEQTRGEAAVDTRTDVYALGVLLYELLTGRLPFDRNQLQRAAMDEVFRVIREEEPPKPSTKFSSVSNVDQADIARQRRTEPHSLIRILRRELEWIPLKAMRKDPESRYRGASEMSDDVHNYLEGQPLTAGPESRRYRLRKFVRRYRWPVAAGIAIAVSLVAGAIGTSVMAVRAERQRALAEERFGDVRELAHVFIFDVYDSIEHLPGSTPAIKQLVDTALVYLEKLEASANIDADDDLWLEIADAYVKLGDVQGNPGVNNLGDVDAGLASYEKAYDIYARWIARLPDNERVQTALANTLTGIAGITEHQGDLDAALTLYQQALEVSQRVCARWPSPENLHRMYGSQYLIAALWFRRGNEVKAREEFRTAVELVDATPDLATSDLLQTDVAMALGRLGQLQASDNDMQLAEQSLTRSLDLLQTLAEQQPNDSTRQRNLAIACDHVARFHLKAKEPIKAIPFMERSSATFRTILDADPSSARAQRDFVISMNRMGDVFRSLERYEEVMSVLDSLVQLADDTYQQYPVFQNGMIRANAVEGVARLMVEQDRFREALTYQQRVISLREQLMATHPENPTVKQRLAFARLNCGESLLKLARPAEALAQFDAAVQANREQLEDAPDRDGSVRRLATSLTASGKALLALDRDEQALDQFDEAIELRRKFLIEEADDIDRQIGLAVTLARAGGALAEYPSEVNVQRSRELTKEAVELLEANRDQLIAVELDMLQTARRRLARVSD